MRKTPAPPVFETPDSPDFIHARELHVLDILHDDLVYATAVCTAAGITAPAKHAYRSTRRNHHLSKGHTPLACQAQNRTTIPSKSGDGGRTLSLTGSEALQLRPSQLATRSVKTILILEVGKA